MTAYELNEYGAVVYPTDEGGEKPFKSPTTRAQYFTMNEVKCHDNGVKEVWVNPALAAALDKLRGDFFARALKIRSAYRSVEYNDGLGGIGTAENREHMYGTAADIEPNGRSVIIGLGKIQSYQWF